MVNYIVFLSIPQVLLTMVPRSRLRYLKPWWCEFLYFFFKCCRRNIARRDEMSIETPGNSRGERGEGFTCSGVSDAYVRSGVRCAPVITLAFLLYLFSRGVLPLESRWGLSLYSHKVGVLAMSQCEKSSRGGKDAHALVLFTTTPSI